MNHNDINDNRNMDVEFCKNYEDSSIYDDYHNDDKENNENKNKNKIIKKSNDNFIKKNNRKKKNKRNDVDPMHSIFQPYLLETNLNPIMTSYGHRPMSASRTFNPCTMKIHLKHDEIIKTTKKTKKTGFGIPVTILAKLLYAPKLRNYDDTNINDFFTENQSNPYINTNDISDNRKDLFLSSSDMIDLGVSNER